MDKSNRALDAALEGGGAVANGWNKRVLLEVKDLRGLHDYTT
jgi:hypothetical protein